MAFEDLVVVNVSLASAVFDRAGFGVPLLLGYHTKFAEWARAYSGDILEGLEDDGFSATDTNGIYRMASMLVRQEVAPQSIVVGRVGSAHTQTVRFTPATPVAGKVYTFAITVAGITQTATFTADSTPTVAEVCAGLTTAINALTVDVTCTDNTTSFDMITTAGKLFKVEHNLLPAEMTVLATTADPSTGYATSLANVINENNDWYCVLLDTDSDAINNVVADAVELLDKICIQDSADTGILTNSTTDVASDREAEEATRTATFYNHVIGGYAACAFAGRMLPTDPGSETWMWKKLRGVVASPLTSSQRGFADGKQCNYYRSGGNGLSITMNGQMGGGRYIDVQRGMDWFKARIAEALIALFASELKVPYTAAGLAQIKGVLEGVTQTAIAQGFLSPGTPDSEEDPIPTVTVPKITDVTEADRAARTVSGVKVSGRVAGAAHTITVNVVLTE
jgi:hypothetical protein